MNIVDSNNCDMQTLDNLINRVINVGDRVKLPDGIYAAEEDFLAAVVVKGRFVLELEIYNEYGESKGN